jgi:hypothetical protein
MRANSEALPWAPVPEGRTGLQGGTSKSSEKTMGKNPWEMSKSYWKTMGKW